jgi:hypothetical protein
VPEEAPVDDTPPPLDLGDGVVADDGTPRSRPLTESVEGPSRGRSIAAGVVGVLAVLGMVAGMLGFWTVDTATDSDRFEEQVAELLEDEEISNALAARVVAELAETIRIRDAVRAVVPEVLEPAIDLLLAGVRSRVEDRTAELIRTPEVAENVAAAAGRAHRAAVDVIEGESVVDGVTVADGEVRVNLLPLMARALVSLQEVGLLRDVTIPQLDRTGDPDDQRAELSAALGRDLPDDFGQPVVFRSDSLDEVGDTVQVVRDLLVLAKRTFWILLVAGVGLGALSIWLSVQRWRAASFIVAGLFLLTLILRLVMARASARLPDVVTGPGARETVRQIVGDLQDSLNQTMVWYAALALVGLFAVALFQFGLPAWRRRGS